MKTVFHQANSRGYADHGWLKSYHTFSFANYFDHERVNFGALRVLNDDHVAGGMGFGKHPHKNMEIISIPLEGKLKHGDNMGNGGIIEPNQIQVMSAGTGIVHSELNGSAHDPVKFLQIWVIPHTEEVTPRYDEIQLNAEDSKNKFQQIVSPNPEDEGAWIHQNAWFHIGRFEKGKQNTYQLQDPNNGVYAFLIDGKIKIEDQELSKRDGLGVWETSAFHIEILEDAHLLLMEVPMN